jgi:hypothetical protein
LKTKKVILIVYLCLIILVLGYLGIFSLLSPIIAVKTLNRTYYDSAYQDESFSETFELEKEVAFLKARAKMFKTDSVCLSINLVDSTVLLELQGVILLTSKISRIQSSDVMKRLHERTYLEFFSEPFGIDTDYSTIPKVAYIIKQAPKDTTESKPPAIKTDSLNQEAVCYSFYLDRNIQIDIRQVDSLKNDQFKNYDKYLRKEKINNLVKSLLKFKIPVCQPSIQIEIPGSDAKAIYKALPPHGQVALKL